MHTWALFSCSGLLTLTAYNLVQSPDAPNTGPEPEPEPSTASSDEEKFLLAALSAKFPESEPTVAGPQLPHGPQLSKLSEGLSAYRASGYDPARYPDENLDLDTLLGTNGIPLPTSVLASRALSSTSGFSTYQTQAVQPLLTPVPTPSISTLQTGSPLGLFAHLARERAIADAAATRARYPLADAVTATATPARVAQPEVPAAVPAFTQSAAPTPVAQSPEASQPAAASTVSEAETTGAVAAAPVATTSAGPTSQAQTIPTVPVAATQPLPAVPVPTPQSAEAVDLAAVPATAEHNTEIAKLPTVPVPSTQSLNAERGVEPTVVAQAPQSTELAVVLPAGSRGELFAPLPNAAVEPNQMVMEVSGDVPPTVESDAPVSTALMQTMIMRRQIFTRLCEEARADANVDNMPAFCAEVINELAQRTPEAATAGTPIPGEVVSPTLSKPSTGVL